MSNEAKELKDCPFCGKPGTSVQICGLAKPNCPRCSDLFGCNSCDVWRDTAEEWNTRTPDPQTTALRSALEEIRDLQISSSEVSVGRLRSIAANALAASEPAPDPIREAAIPEHINRPLWALIQQVEYLCSANKQPELPELTALKAALSGKETKDARD